MARQISLKGRCLTLAQPGFRMCVKAPRGLSEAGRDVVVAWTSNSPRRSTSSCHSLFADVLATVHASAHDLDGRRVGLPTAWS
jgi:hypothetical protein